MVNDLLLLICFGTNSFLSSVDPKLENEGNDSSKSFLDFLSSIPTKG